METTPRRADCDVSDAAPGLATGADAYLERLSKEQTRFLGALADANTMLPGPTSQLARVAAVQSRLAQEFLDAQRAIIKRRAETEAAVVCIAASAEAEADALFAQARSASVAASVSGSMPHPAPTGHRVAKPAPVMARTPGAATDWPAPRASTSADADSLARLIDAAFEGAEPDGAAMKRQLRELLDEWWSIENQEDKAAIDDANARAAMRVHVATVEADQIVQAAAVREEFAAPKFTYEPPKHVPPLVAALDSTTHEDLDEMLASLLDALDAPIGLPEDQADVALDEAVPSADVAPIVDAGFLIIDAPPAATLAAPTGASVPVLPANPLAKVALPYGRPDSLNDETAAPQEAFDRFWGTLTARRPGGRDWVFMQVLFPAVAVIAVLALVLAVVG